MRSFVLVILAALLPASASASQSFYFHYSAANVTVPGGTTHHYMNQTAPGTGTPTVLGPVGITQGSTVTVQTFVTTPFASAIDLERLTSVTVNISANHVMNDCATLTATLARLDASGTPTLLASGVLANVDIPQGSGGGLAGYEARTIPLQMDVDRKIPNGGGFNVKLEVTNGCGSNVSVRLVFDGAVNMSNHSRAEFVPPDVTLFARSGTFGLHTDTLTDGTTLARSYVPAWVKTDPGVVPFNGDVASDGSVFIGGMYDGINPISATSCTTAITCFNPWSKECPTAGAPDHFSTIRIPDRDGNVFTPPTATLSSCVPPHYDSHATPPYPAMVAATDVADVRMIDDSGEYVMFTGSNATLPTFIQPGSQLLVASSKYPVTGRLSKASGAWELESPRYVDDLYGDPEGPDACAGALLPNCALLSEFMQLPGSGHIIAMQYARGGTGAGSQGNIAALDQSGAIVAHYAEPIPQTDSCNLGVWASDKTVSVDPTSAASCGSSGCSDERFVVSYDNFTNPTSGAGELRSFAIQEFRYDTTVSPPAITPVSAPLFAATAAYPAQPCGTESNEMMLSNTAIYDHQGNMWIHRTLSETLGSAVDLYVPDPGTGNRKIETDCAYAGSTWGVSCTPDCEYLGLPPGILRGVEDTATGAMIFVGIKGELAAIVPDSESPCGFKKKETTISLDVDKLATTPNLWVWRGAMDVSRRTLLLPVFPPIKTLGLRHDSWLYAVDVDRLLAKP